MSDTDPAPTAFISHSSVDKSRFVTEFARRLFESGVNAWYDQWEMRAGDSIVQNVYNEGLKSADTVIAVLSKHSIESPWVREELNSATIKRIERSCRIIPILIDECEVPMPLRTLTEPKAKV